MESVVPKDEKVHLWLTNPQGFTLREADADVLYFVPQIGVLENLSL